MYQLSMLLSATGDHEPTSVYWTHHYAFLLYLDTIPSSKCGKYLSLVLTSSSHWTAICYLSLFLFNYDAFSEFKITLNIMP